MNIVTQKDAIEFLSHDVSEANLIYLDPPYGHGSFGKQDLTWVGHALKLSLDIISNDGIVYLHIDPMFIADYHSILPWDLFRGQIIWRTGWVSGFKSKSTKFWPRNYQLILGFAKKDWRYRRILKQSDEYKGVRRHSTGEMPSKLGFVYDDVWTDINPVDQMSFSKEKVSWMTQKPVKLLMRLIAGSSDEGDLIVDPCCGSGTTLVAAQRLNRLYLGNDINLEAVEITKKRLSGVSELEIWTERKRANDEKLL